jgi:predicted small secreted protein
MKSIVILMLALSLGACGTIGGMGKDVTDAAEWSKEKISKSLK